MILYLAAYSFLEAILCTILVFVLGSNLSGEYMNGSLFSEPRYMNGVGFELSGHTPVPK